VRNSGKKHKTGDLLVKVRRQYGSALWLAVDTTFIIFEITALQAGRSRVPFPMVSLEFLLT
jgi:hypothetical protein